MSLTQNTKPIKINDYLEKHRDILNLKIIIASGILESSGDGLGGSEIKTEYASSSFEGSTLFTRIEFSDDDYILVGHKCHMTLHDNGDMYQVTSIYVHPSKRRRGYATAFLKTKFDVDKPIEVDAWVQELKEIIELNPMMCNYLRDAK